MTIFRKVCKSITTSLQTLIGLHFQNMFRFPVVPVVSIVGGDASTLANLEEGSSALTLECRADGNPSPYVWWTKNGQVIATNGAKLILAPVSRNHSGELTVINIFLFLWLGLARIGNNCSS